METIGQKLRKLRINKDISQDELAAKAGISQPAYQRLESDNFKRVPVDIISKIAKALGVEDRTILENEDDLAHLEPYLRDFVRDPANKDAIEWCFAMVKLKKSPIGVG